MNIRPTTAADVDAPFDIRLDVRENQMTLEEPAAAGVTHASVAEALGTHSRGWIAEAEGRPAAFSMANAEEGTVFALFVRRGFEQRGLGRALPARASAWLFERGWDEIWLLTGGDAAGADAFYRHVGWRDEGVQADGQLRYTLRRPRASPQRE